MTSTGSATVRRFDRGAAEALEHYLDSPLLATGQINLISLDAIAERLGSRWATRREPVYDYTERVLEKHLGESGHFLKVSETDFLVVLPDEQRFAAQSRCLRYLSEVLTYFLGKAYPGDLRVREVTLITRDSLEARPIDPVAVAASADQAGAQDIEATTPGRTVNRWTPFATSKGRNVVVSCGLEPVFELKHYTQIGNRIVRRVIGTDTGEPLTAPELGDLSRRDIVQIDLATAAHGLNCLDADCEDQRPLSLIIPVSFVSLSNQLGRADLVAMFRKATAFVRAAVICEIDGIEGVPQAALLAAASLVRPHCKFVVGRLEAEPVGGLSNLRDAGLNAISFQAPQGLVGDAEFHGWSTAAIRMAKRVTKSVMIYRLASPRQLGIAALMGASHASLSTPSG